MLKKIKNEEKKIQILKYEEPWKEWEFYLQFALNQSVMIS